MTSLWIGAALLSLAAVLFIVWPLMRRGGAETAVGRREANIALYRQHLAELEAGRDAGAVDQAQFETLKLELERSLLADSDTQEFSTRPKAAAGARGVLALLALVLPAVGIGLYWQLGASQDWQILELVNEMRAQQEADFQAGRPPSASSAEALAASLASRLQQRPENRNNWFLLARTRMELQDYLAAVQAYQQVLRLDPESGQVMGELAQATFLAAGNRMTPEVHSLVTKTLELMPHNATALGLAGVAAFEVGAYQRAIDFWGRALDVIGRESASARALLAGIARARMALAEAGNGAVADSEKAGVGLSMRVSLADGVPYEPGQVIFVYARAWQGPKLPLAIQRVSVEDLPLEITLDETMAMAPGMSITSFPELELVARLSRDGSATPQSGDWLATLGPIKLAELPPELHLEIAAQLP